MPPSAAPLPPRSLLAIAFALGLIISPVHAQTVAPPQPAAEEPVIELSPFYVDTTRDVGYVANSTLSGSRTNTEIRDIANPLDIFTKELIQDLGVTDIQDLTLFANNVEPNAAGDLNSDGQEREIWNYNYMQIRGFKTGTATRNFMELNSTYEAYNSERVEFSKGPNSILFGAGNPGGTTNYTTKVPMFSRNTYSAQHRADDLGSQRVSMDLNQVVIPGKLALRLNALWEDREFDRGPAYEKEKAWHLVAAWQPTPNTKLTVGHEKRDSDRASPRGVFARDRVTGWLQAGAPRVTAVPANNQVVLNDAGGAVAAATVGLGTNNSDVWIIDNVTGQVRNARRTAAGAIYRPASVHHDIVASGLQFPRDIVVSGPNGINDTRWDITEVNLTHRFTDDLHLDLSYGKSETSTRQGQSVSNDLFVDPNDFGENRNYGRYFTQTRPFRVDRDVRIEDFRATLSYDLDLRKTNKWLGVHRAGLMYEKNVRDEVWDNGRLTLVKTPNGVVNPTAISNGFQNNALALNYRTYLDLQSGVSSGRDLRAIYYSNGVEQDGYVARFLRREPWAALKTRTDQDTILGILQSRWWDNRIVTTFGWREDDRTFHEAPFQRHPVTRLWIPEAMLPGTPDLSADNGIPSDAQKPHNAAFINPPKVVKGISRNYGGVFHANKWLSFTYSYTTNFSPRTESRDLHGQFVQASTGESHDYGVRLDLFDGRVNVSLLRFQTRELNSITNGNSISSPIPRMKDAEQILLDNGITSTNLLALDGNFTTSDRTAEGEELLVVGNPTPRWNLRLSASRLENRLTNIAPDIRAFYTERMAFYRAQNPALQAIGNTTTLGTRISQAEELFALLQTRENVKSFPASEYTARFTGKYTFARDSAMSGFSAGGNARWSSAPTIGYYLRSNGAFDVNREYKADDQTLIDLFFIYQRRIGRVDWRIQLNIDNVFNDDDPVAVAARNSVDAANFSWLAYRFRPQDGRVISLTNTITF